MFTVDSSTSQPVAGGLRHAGDFVRRNHHTKDHQRQYGGQEEVVVEVRVDEATRRDNPTHI